MTYKGTFAYIEFITRSVSRIKRDGKIIKQHNENTISGHYEVIDEDSKMILLRENELEIPVAKKDIIKFELKNKPDEAE